MAKAAAKKKKPKRTDKEQFARFVEAARKHGVNDSMEDFQVKFRKIVPAKRRKTIAAHQEDDR
jgi:hypothetical protein